MKIRDLVGRALVRYFGRPATSVPPKLTFPANKAEADLFFEKLAEFNRDAEQIKAIHKEASDRLDRIARERRDLRDHEANIDEAREAAKRDIDRNMARIRDDIERKEFAALTEPRPMTGEDLARQQAEAKDHDHEPFRLELPGLDAVHAEVQRRLKNLDIPKDASPEEAHRRLIEAMADLPGVSVSNPIGPGHPDYEAAVQRHAEQEALAEIAEAEVADEPSMVENLSWDTWTQWMSEVKAPAGWSPCRFGARTSNDMAAQVFGVARAEFGVYTKPFHVCDPIHDERSLAALIHLPSGTGLGVFMSQVMAIEAGDLALALGIDWRIVVDPTKPETWTDARHRLEAAWHAAGLHIAPFHAHDKSDIEIPVWMSSHHTKTAGKPAKGMLS